MIHVKAWGKDIGQLIEHKGILKFKYEKSNILDFSPKQNDVSQTMENNFIERVCYV